MVASLRRLLQPLVLFGQRRRKHFITTPIFYVNGEPHLGHLYTATLADTNFRWNRWKNGRDPYATGSAIEDDDIFVVGTDEHGLKVQKAAEKSKMTPIEHCDFYSERFRQLFRKFDINYTHFVRTSQKEHEKAVKDFWNRLKSKGYIYKGSYEGWYSIRDECFYNEEEIEDTVGEDGNRIKRSIESKTEVEWTKENNYMFDWAKFHDDIRKWFIDSQPIAPSSNLPGILQLMRINTPLSLSRDSKRFQWGIPVPDDESQTIYVWFDALVSYLTAGGYPNPHFRWPADIHFVGKDIRTFHALYWPAFLMAADMPLPKKIYIHSHWVVDGIKMTKSLGNVVSPFLVANLLTTDGMRYFMLKQGTLHSDANFTLNKAVHLVNTDLVNNLANLISRSTGKQMNPKQKYPSFDLEVMEHVLKGTGEKIVLALNELSAKVGEHYDKMLFHRGLEELANATKNANAFFQLHQPWNMSEGPDKQTILFIICETIRIVNLLLQPIVPSYADRTLSRLGIEKHERTMETARFAGGPTIKLYGRPLGEECQIMHRIQHEPENNPNGKQIGKIEI